MRAIVQSLVRYLLKRLLDASEDGVAVFTIAFSRILDTCLDELGCYLAARPFLTPNLPHNASSQTLPMPGLGECALASDAAWGHTPPLASSVNRRLIVLPSHRCFTKTHLSSSQLGAESSRASPVYGFVVRAGAKKFSACRISQQ